MGKLFRRFEKGDEKLLHENEKNKHRSLHVGVICADLLNDRVEWLAF
jgi:hypothetical protein